MRLNANSNILINDPGYILIKKKGPKKLRPGL